MFTTVTGNTASHSPAARCGPALLAAVDSHRVGLFTVCLLLALCLMPFSAMAQEAATGGEAAQPAPAYPAGLDDPAIDRDQLRLRLIPLTLDDLRPLAEAWQGRARTAAQAVVDKSLEVRAATEADAEQLRQERVQLVVQRDGIFDKFLDVVSDLEGKGGDAAEVEVLRKYVKAIKGREVSRQTPQEFADSFLQWLTSSEGGLQIGFRIAVILASLFALFVVAGIVRSWAGHVVNRASTLSRLLRGFLVKLVYWLTIAIGLMIVLAALGVNITPLFAVLGGASFIIAFALQDTLGNLASGLMIMINRPFDEGDFVDIAGLSGKVRRVSVVSTTVVTPDNQIIVIPNSKVWGDVITNVTASATRRVDLVFGIGYGDSIDKAHEVLEDIVARHPLILEEPEPVVRVSELGDSSVNFIVRPWTKTENYWAVYWDLQREVKEAFDANGISIPFPQTDMHVHVVGQADNPAENGLPVATGNTGGDK